MSEYGFQSYPEMATIETFTTSEDRKLGSPALNNHQKHGRGVEIIRKAMKEEFGYTRTEDLDEFAYMSQLVQALGIRQAIDAHRSQHDRCAGTLCWQLNDCWPVASWSSIDYTGRWKALHYQLREAYSNVAVTAHVNDNQTVDFYLVNDSLSTVKGTMKITAFALDGTKTQVLVSKQVSASPNSGKKVSVCHSSDLKDMRANQVCLVAQLESDGKVLAQKVCFFVKPGELSLRSETIHQEFKNYGDRFELTLTCPTFCYGVQVRETTGKDVRWSDNYFHLLPNVPKTIYGYYDQMDGEPKLAVRCWPLTIGR
jgi:beta-mannosidase